MEFDLNQLKELITILNQTDVDELTLKSSDFDLTIRKSKPTGAVQVVAPIVAESIPSPEPEPSSPPPGPDKKWTEVTSPMVGTFYRSPAPDEPPFVDVGDRVKKSQTLCIIEAMKLMNELEAELNGEIMEILVENGEPVEFGQPLMWINPSS